MSRQCLGVSPKECVDNVYQRRVFSLNDEVLGWSCSFFALITSRCMFCLKKEEEEEKNRPAKGNRNPSAITDEMYAALIILASGEDFPPVEERSRAQKSAGVRYLGSM